MKKIYLSGPMTGFKDYNYPMFNDAAKKLRAEGFEVVNPAEFPKQKSWNDYMKYALGKIPECDTIVTLPGWIRSRGAKKEIYEAERLCMGVVNHNKIRVLKNIKPGEKE